MQCPVLNSTHMIGKKWSLPILEEIAFGNFHSFNGFIKKSGSITPRVLSNQLKELENAGLVKKKNGIMATYILTDKGIELHKLIAKMKKWDMKWNNAHVSCAQTPCTSCPNFR